jgi:hypothetical protein
VRENVRMQEERLNPDRAERWNSSKLRSKVRCADERGLRSVIIASSHDQCNRARVIRAIAIGVNACVQLRRNTQEQRPEKRSTNGCRDKNVAANRRARERAHCAAIF